MPSARDMFSIVPLMVITRSILKLLTSFKLDIKRFLDQLLLSKKTKHVCFIYLDTVILVSVSSITRLMVLPPLPIIRPIRLLCARIFSETSLLTIRHEWSWEQKNFKLGFTIYTLCWCYRLPVASLLGCGDKRWCSSPDCRKWWWPFPTSRHSLFDERPPYKSQPNLDKNRIPHR